MIYRTASNPGSELASNNKKVVCSSKRASLEILKANQANQNFVST